MAQSRAADQTSNGEFDAPLQENKFPPSPPKTAMAKGDAGPWWKTLLASPVKRLKLGSWHNSWLTPEAELLALPPPVLVAQSPEPHTEKCLQKKEDRGRRDLPVRPITLKIWQRQTEETQ